MASNYFAPGHSQRNPYGTYDAYKGYQAGEQQKRNQMTVGGTNGSSGNGWESSVNQANDFTGQMLGMLGVPQMPNYYNGMGGGSQGGGGGGNTYGGNFGNPNAGGGGQGGTATTTGQIGQAVPYGPDLTQMGINQARADAFTDPYLMRESMIGSGVAADSPGMNMQMAPQIAQMMSNMGLQSPVIRSQDALANAQAALQQMQSSSRENLGMAQNMGQLSDLNNNFQQGQLQNILSALFGFA